MTFTNAVAKLERAGFAVTLGQPSRPDLLPGPIYARKSGRVITCYRNGVYDLVATINVRSENDHDDMQSDYFAGSYCRNLAQAIRFAVRS